MNCRRRPASFRTRKATEAQRHGGGIEILFNCCLVVLGVSVPLWQNVNYNLRERRKQMPYKKLTIGGAKQEILSWANHDFSIEEQSMVRNVSRLPCLFKHVALMPDAHLGTGSMVRSVVARKQAVIPATVGVDIGCGMMAVKTPFKSGILDGKSKDLRLAIEEAIPVGFNTYRESVDESSYWDGWKDFSELHKGVTIAKQKR